MTIARMRRLLLSFRVKAFRLDLDTGNPILNARLYPLTYLPGPGTGAVRINFQNRNNIRLQIVNRPIYILKALINPKK